MITKNILELRKKRNEYMRRWYRKKIGDKFGKSKFAIKYTDGEIKFIKDNYKTMSNLQLSKKLSKSLAAIKDKISRMREEGIRLTRTNKEIMIHRKNAVSYMNRQYPKYAMKRTWREMVTLPNGQRILKSHYVLLGKPVQKGYVVHHKDMNPKNNSKDNLMLMSKAEHNRFHTSNNGIYGQLKMNGELR